MASQPSESQTQAGLDLLLQADEALVRQLVLTRYADASCQGMARAAARDWQQPTGDARQRLLEQARSHALESGCLYCAFELILAPDDPLGVGQDAREHVDFVIGDLLEEKRAEVLGG